jgi:hypothetical protein
LSEPIQCAANIANDRQVGFSVAVIIRRDGCVASDTELLSGKT